MNRKLKPAGKEPITYVRLVDEINRISSDAHLSTSSRDAWTSKVCTSLKAAYDRTPAYIYVVDLELPGGPPKSSSKMGVDDPRQPGDEDTDYGVRLTSRPNPHKKELLDQGLALGCAWANEVQEQVN